jgi:hypothetical protein
MTRNISATSIITHVQRRSYDAVYRSHAPCA